MHCQLSHKLVLFEHFYHVLKTFSAVLCGTQCDFHFITRHPFTFAQLHVTTGKHGWQLWLKEQNFYNNHCALRQECTQSSVTYFSNIQLSIVRGCICCTTSGKQSSQLFQLKRKLNGIFWTVVCDWGMWTRMSATKRNIPRRYGTLHQNISRHILPFHLPCIVRCERVE